MRLRAVTPGSARPVHQSGARLIMEPARHVRVPVSICGPCRTEVPAGDQDVVARHQFPLGGAAEFVQSCPAMTDSPPGPTSRTTR